MDRLKLAIGIIAFVSLHATLLGNAVFYRRKRRASRLLVLALLISMVVLAVTIVAFILNFKVFSIPTLILMIPSLVASVGTVVLYKERKPFKKVLLDILLLTGISLFLILVTICLGELASPLRRLG